jgi:hypothetical protein
MLSLNIDGCNENSCYGICGCQWDGTKCTVPRSDQEVCEPITKYYNPLYIKDKLTYYDKFQSITHNILNCDDVIGDQLGEYHCLGIAIL